tara:strand:- start:141 stop:332 length:192 start_codon:yes stop_codon:yes gene_type:complete
MAADKEDFTERLSAFQKDLNALLDKHQFQELYRKIIEENCLQEAKLQMTKKAVAAYKKNQEES